MKKDKRRMIFIGILIIFLVNINFIVANYQQYDSNSYMNNNKCQSGLREDNTNYIYCARQNLTFVPNFFQTHIGISNVVYDELVLSDNLITQLDKNTFSTSLKVRKLYLDLNPIRYIDKIAFEYLRNYLEELYLDLKLLTGDEMLVQSNHDYNDYLENDEQINEEIDDGVLFEQSILQSCFNLRLLSIKNYNIKKLRSFKFTKMNKLEILTLSKLKLKRIDDNAFVGLEQSLIELNLDSNYIESISISSIEQLKRLKKLNLSQNRIKHLTANSFFKFSSTLNYLDLSYNYLSKIDENAFNGPIQNGLKYLQLQNNELKWPHFINILYNLHLLQELNIDFNKLFISNNNEITDSTFMPNIYNKTSYIYLKLSSLSMQGNGLTLETLNMFENSYDYDIASNSFEYTSSYIPNKDRKQFKFTNLTKLNLARNKITQIPDKFFDKLNMTMLKAITLDRNPLEVTKFNNDTFYGLEKSLQSLALNNVGIDVFSSNFIQSLNILDNLQTLKLNNNNNKNSQDYETELAPFKLNLKNLNSLELQNNNIKRIPSYFCQLENLRDLDLSSNKLSNFDLNCLLFKLKDNYYESTSLNHLNLNNNPLKCDCNMRQLKIWLMRNYEKDFLEFIKWKCNEPFELNEKLLTSINLNDLKCEEKRRDDQILIHNEENVSTTTESKTTQLTTTRLETVTTISLINKTEILNLVSSHDNKKLINNELSYNGYYTLIISTSFGISMVCLMLLILFYFVFIRKHQQYQYKNSSIISNINSDYLNYNTTSNNNLIITSNGTNMNGGDCMIHKNKLTFLTSSQSPSGCSSSASTSSSGTSSLLFNNTTKKFDLIGIFANESNHDHPNLYLHQSMNLNEFQLFNSESSSNNYNHLNNLFLESKNRNMNNNNNNTMSKSNQNTDFCSDYNNLNYDDSIFSIESSMLNSANCDNHIYHEINTPKTINKMKPFVNHNRATQQHFKYGNQSNNNNNLQFSTSSGLFV